MSDTLLFPNGIVHGGFACAWNIMYVQAQAVTNAVGEECRTDTARKDRLFAVPAPASRRVWSVEDAKCLETAHEYTMA